MKHILLIIFVLIICGESFSQPSWAKKTIKSVFTLKTFSADGALVGESTGFFVGEEGQAVSSFAPFKGAATAVVIDAQGKEMSVDCLLGANDTYDVAKFKVDVKKSQPLTVASEAAAVGGVVWLQPYRDVKKSRQGHVDKAETFNGGYAYYTLEMIPDDAFVGAPVLNANGQVIALLQQSANNSKMSYAVSAVFADSLRMTGLSLNDPALRSTSVKKALPTDVAQAQLMLYLASTTTDSASYAALVNDFIAQFPTEQDGYINRAQLSMAADHCEEADRDMNEALRVAQRPDEVHMSWSRIIYQKVLYRPEPPYEPWTLERALLEAQEAYRLNAQPGYQQQQAYVLFALKRYDEASAVYSLLFQSTLRSADIFYEASRCREMVGDTLGQLALLDSAVAQFSRPYLKQAANYLLARAQVLMSIGRYRLAVTDLNDYESLMKAQLSDGFFYLRHQAEVGGKLFQQALDDIAQAIKLSPKNSLYYAEKASLEVRVGLYDEAIASASSCIEVAPEVSDGFLFLGLAQCLKGQKAEGLKNLQKAGELGDGQASELIEKYAK